MDRIYGCRDRRNVLNRCARCHDGGDSGVGGWLYRSSFRSCWNHGKRWPFLRDTLGGDAGGDDGDPHGAFHRLVEGGAEDDVSFRIDFLPDPVGGLVDFEQGHVHPAGDVDQHAPGTFHCGVLKQRVVDRGLGSVDSAFFAA